MQRPTNTIALLLFIITLANILLHYLAGSPIQANLFNADALYLPTLFSDLFSNGGSLKDWFLTPAPYFFPDYPIFLFAYLAWPTAYGQIIIFSLIQTLLTFLALRFLAQQVHSTAPLLIAATVSTLLVGLALKAGEPFALILNSAYHYGIFFVSIIFLALYIKSDEAKEQAASWANYLGLALLAFASTLSDNLFLVQTVAPLCMTHLLIQMIEHDFSLRRKRLPIIVAVSSILGSVSYGLVIENHTRPSIDIKPSSLMANLNEMSELIISILSNNPAYGVVFILYAGIALYILTRSLISGRKITPLDFAVIFSLASLCTTLGAIALTDLVITSRYLIPTLSWPIIIVTLLSNRYYPGKSTRYIILSASMFVVISISGDAYQLTKKNGLNHDFYPSEISCIDNHLAPLGLSYGISQYWDAKPIQLLSQTNLNIAQYLENLDEMHWITSGRYFRNYYDFAIFSEDSVPPNKLPSDILTRINGTPNRIVHCGRKSIHIYNKGGLRTKKFSAAGNTYTWKACELPTVIGTHTNACETYNEPNTSGYITFGPYEKLPAGQYAFEISYLSDAAPSDPTGSWDVVVALPQEAKILSSGVIHGTKGNINSIKGLFTLEPEFHMEKIEIRTLSLHNSSIKIKYLTLEKLE